MGSIVQGVAKSWVATFTSLSDFYFYYYVSDMGIGLRYDGDQDGL